MTKGDCYEANANWCMGQLLDGGRKYNRTIRLCHGTVIGAKGSPVEGKEILHCWVEVNNDMFFDFSNGKAIGQRIEMIQHRIIKGKTKKYTLNQASKMLLGTTNYGAWTDEEEERFIGKRIIPE